MRLFLRVSAEKQQKIEREGYSMTLSETYEKMGGNYKDVIGRFYSQELVDRFLRKFPDDPSMQDLREAFEKGESKDAFCAAHTLKGVCQSLAITNLLRLLSPMTELLRKGDLEQARLLLPEAEKQYDITINAIREYMADAQKA